MTRATDPPTTTGRYTVVAVTALAAMWMYIDRVSFSTLADTVRADLGVGPDRMAYVLSAFFFSYALFQIPAGMLADRFGPRVILVGCVVGWSAATAFTSLADGFIGLLAARLLLGISEAGAYPAATGLVRDWATPGERGLFSSIVALGGRFGLAAAPYLTGILAIALAGFTLGVGPRVGVEGNWRAVFVVYGVSGFVVAGLLWTCVRDRVDPAGPVLPSPIGCVSRVDRLKLLAANRNIWLFGGYQMCTNVGWAFLITLFPTYLAQVHGVSLEDRGRMQSVPLAVGCVGMLMGGLLTDRLVSRFGLRWGRSLPLGLAMAGCIIPAVACPFLPGPWEVVASLAVMAFLIDLACPSVWAFSQDVGGRNVGAAFGWGNMWGNLGAAASPVLLNELQSRFGWPAAFTTCAGFFLVAGACGLLLNAARPLGENAERTTCEPTILEPT